MTTARTSTFLGMALAIALASGGCGSDDDGGHGGGNGPAAPTNLRATNVSGGAHLTWEDNSTDEEEFVVMRKASTETTYTTVATLPFNSVQYHDAALTAGTTYAYHVMATNADGESASNEITFTAP